MATAHDTFDLVAQREAEEQAREKAKLQEKLDLEALLWVMRDKRGRRFIWGLLSRSGTLRLSFHTNALTMAFNEGTRNEGLALTAKLMEHAPDVYMTMLKEHASNE